MTFPQIATCEAQSSFVAGPHMLVTLRQGGTLRFNFTERSEAQAWANKINEFLLAGTV